MSNSHFIRRIMPTKKKPSLRFTLDIETWGLDARKLAFGVIQNVDTLEQYVFYDFESGKKWIQEKRKEYMEINGISEKDSRVLVYGHNAWKFDYLGFFTIDEIKQADKIDSKGRILVATIDGVEYRDYKTLVQVSLSQIGEALGFPKGTTPMKFMIGDESQGITQEDIDRGRARGGSDNAAGITTSTGTSTIDGNSVSFSFEENSNYLQVPPEIIGITKIFKFDGSNTVTNNMFSVKYQLFLNDMYYWGSTEILTYEMTKRYLEDIDFVLSTDKQ